MTSNLAIEISDLHTRHDISRALSDMLCEAASVCLSRHHAPPRLMTIEMSGEGDHQLCTVIWQLPGSVTLRSHDDSFDATEHGAYAVALAAVEAHLGLIAIGRARRGTGADYLLKPGPLGAPEPYPPNYEGAIRLEVSGTDVGPESEVRRRLARKVSQVKNGNINGPALAGVVGFLACVIALEGVEA